MLFDSSVPQVMQQTFQTFQSRTTTARKQQGEKLLELYNGQQLEDLKTDLIRYTGNTDQLKPVCINIVKKIINRLTQVYAKSAARIIVDGTERDQEVFDGIMDNAKYALKLKQASRYTKLLKTVLIKISFRSGAVQLDILPPDIIDVETGSAPDDIQAVTVTIYPASGKVQETEYHRWTVVSFETYNYKGDLISREPNIYGIIPFVAVHDSLPVDEFFQPIPEDLISLQESINLKLSDLLHTISLQAFGQPVTKGLKGHLKIGPNNAVELPADTRDLKHDFKFADTQAKIDETVNAIEKLINWAYISHGLPASSITADVSEASGKAKEVDNYELNELRQDDQELFRIYEQELFQVVRTVHNAHALVKLSDKARVKVDFAEIKPPITEKEQVDTWERLLDLGLISIVDVAMKRNPDLTREEAEAQIFQVQEDNRIMEGKSI